MRWARTNGLRLALAFAAIVLNAAHGVAGPQKVAATEPTSLARQHAEFALDGPRTTQAPTASRQEQPTPTGAQHAQPPQSPKAQNAPGPPEQQPAAPQAPAAAQASAAPQTFEISGTVRAGKTPLPGVTVTAANTLTGKKFAVATAANGTYLFTGLPRGRYVVRVEFMGFAPQTQEVALKPETPAGKFDAEMILASRQPQDELGGVAAAAALLSGGRGFQSLAVDSALSALSGGASGGMGQGGAGAGDISGLPLNGAGADAPTESVSVNGAQGRTQDFGAGSEADLQERIQEFRDRAQQEGRLSGGPGGPGGGPGGPGGFAGGGPMVVRMGGKGFNINQPHGVIYASDDAATLDASPYSLTGLITPKASYNLSRFGAMVGGPLNIPKIFHGGDKWFFFGGWNATRGSTPYDAFSTVPTLAERGGDFSGATYKSGSPVQLFNPAGSQFQVNGASCVQANIINPACISPSAQALLQYIPLPNLNTATQNFHYVTSATSSADNVSFRLIHNFGSSPGGPIMIGGPFGGGGGGGRRRAQNNINFGLNWTRSATGLVNPFPSLAGGTGVQGLNASAGWVYGKGRATNNLRINYNHNHVSTTNLYSTALNVAGNAEIQGISTNPFDWGLPSLSFTSFGGLNDPVPRRELDQTYTVSDTVVWNRGKHNWRFGADYHRILQSFRSAKNAEGGFIFSGFATSQIAPGSTTPVPNTGYDFADFLLGVPQETSIQSGISSYNFSGNSYDAFAQDDWRLRSNLSFHLGVRYEYVGPYTEANGHITDLYVAPGFGAVQAVVPAGAVLPAASNLYTPVSSASLLHPDRNNYAPRLGLAWTPVKNTVLRMGYGINYNLAQYATMAQNFAFQPPWAFAATNFSAAPGQLTLQNGFPAASPSSLTNNFAVDPNYRLGYVQIWNVDLQQTLPHNFLLNIGYNGAKGTHLDEEVAPNLLIPGVQPFTYESSAANSIYHAGSVRIRRRFGNGLGFSAQYIFSKAIDDASSIGGNAEVVAQNALNIAADRGLSSFDQRHRFSGTWIYELPFGETKRFLQKGAWTHILGQWQWSGDFTLASGLPFTPRVLGNAFDLSRGVSGSLRANYVPGQLISLANPTTAEWFNTAAFCSPGSTPGSQGGGTSSCANPNGTTFGDAGRNIIEGPAQYTMDMNLSKTITIKESRALELRIQAANVFNTVQFTGLDTVVNSLTFGQITSAGNMRRVTMLARFRF